MPPVLRRAMNLLCLPARWISWLTLPLIVSILLAVLYAKLGRNTVMSWEQPLPVLSRSLTVNGLYDLQWHMFALIVLFGGAWALRDNRHVSVDFLSLMMSPRQRLWVRMGGDLFFLLPFCAIIVWYGWSFALVAWNTAEGSTQGGLNSRWIIKAMLPVSFAMLGLLGAIRAAGTALQLIRGDYSEDDQ